MDSARHLSDADIKEINSALEQVRNTADIWGAVFLIEDLGDESIESLAERAFRTWKLGRAKVDNGLLLVLAMKNRKSRFEVGYGLEGELPDAITRRALDEILRPNMRKGDTKRAIIDSFDYLAAIKNKTSPPTHLIPSDSQGDRHPYPQPVVWAMGFYLFCVWLLRPITAFLALVFARRLGRIHPEFHIQKDKKVNQGKFSLRYLLVGDLGWGSLFLRLFFSINPGAFIAIGSRVSQTVFYGVLTVCTFTIILYFRSFAGRYYSIESYQAFLKRLQKKNRRYVEKGYMRETSPGIYEFTSAYYSSSEYRSSSSRSSSGGSSSRSSSSSGGGSSGGGGSSSSW